jgi:hypothetical protein
MAIDRIGIRDQKLVALLICSLEHTSKLVVAEDNAEAEEVPGS